MAPRPLLACMHDGSYMCSIVIEIASEKLKIESILGVSHTWCMIHAAALHDLQLRYSTPAAFFFPAVCVTRTAVCVCLSHSLSLFVCNVLSSFLPCKPVCTFRYSRAHYSSRGYTGGRPHKELYFHFFSQAEESVLDTRCFSWYAMMYVIRKIIVHTLL